MLLFSGGLALLAVAVWIFCIIDVITTPDGETRHLSKVVWLLIVILLADIGSIAWLVAGRPWNGTTRREPLRDRGGARQPARPRPGRRVPSNPDDDEEFLAQLRARAEEQRRRARDAQGGGDDDPPAVD